MSVAEFRKINLEKNEVAVERLGEILERFKSGESLAFAIVEVKRAGTVATQYVSDGKSYHELNSGAATLAHRIASAGE